MDRRICTYLGFIILVVNFASPARAGRVPAHWNRLGTVQAWADVDHERGHWGFGTRRETQVLYDGDQQEIYLRTYEHTSRWARVDLAEWSGLAPDEQAQRRGAAISVLEYVHRFRRDKAARGGNWSNTRDITVMADLLQKLHTATGVDPTHAYAWHLLGWLAQSVGDAKRAAAAYAQAERALDLLGPQAPRDVRRRLATDQAWLRRDLGDFARASAHVAEAEELGGATDETRILRGLIAAQTGREQEAVELAARVGHIPVGRRHLWGAPEKPSDFAKAWILALLYLHLGEAEMAEAAFGEYGFQDRYPPYAHHFWHDAGGIYRRTGRPDEALGAWRMASFWRPYRPFYVDRRYGWKDTVLTGIQGETINICGYDRFFTTGDRLSYASRYAEAAGAARTLSQRQTLAAVALEQLEICRRTGYLHGHAQQGSAMVYADLEDMDSARYELRAGKRYLRERGVAIPEAPAGTEVVVIRSTAGRYDDDPEATLEVLTRDWNAERTPENGKALGLFLIRHGNASEGRELVLRGREHVDPLALPVEDLCILLEADRALGDRRLAERLVEALASGEEGLPADSQVWALAAFCFIDAGLREQGRPALERAAALAPQNRALQMQLRLLSR